jgi:hypothetical protein
MTDVAASQLHRVVRGSTARRAREAVERAFPPRARAPGRIDAPARSAAAPAPSPRARAARLVLGTPRHPGGVVSGRRGR